MKMENVLSFIQCSIMVGLLYIYIVKFNTFLPYLATSNEIFTDGCRHPPNMYLFKK